MFGHETERSPTRWDAAILFGLALVPRLLHLREIARNDPFFLLPSVDGRVYDEWARAIASGDLVGEGVLTLGPLYPYTIGLLYGLVGEELFALKLFQALLGAFTAVLAYGLTRELFDRRAGWVAGLLVAAYGMLIFYGGAVMVVNVQVPLVLGTVWLTVRAEQAPSFGRWLAAGIVLGAAVLARQTVLLYAPILLIWVLFGAGLRVPERARLRWAGALCLGLFLLIAPFTIRNVLVGEDWVLVSAAGGPNLYMGNRRGADGRWSPPPLSGDRIDDPVEMREGFRSIAEARLGRSLRASEVSAYWTERAIGEVVEAPAEWLQLQGKKLLLFFNAQEVWNNRSKVISGEFSWVLRAPLVGFALVFPMAVVGGVLTASRWRSLFPLYAMLGVYLASALLFFVLSRYRMPAAALLCVFAGAGAVGVFERARAGRWGALAALALVFVGGLGLTRIDLGGSDLHMAWYNLGNKYRNLRQYDRAIDSYRRSLETAPAAISTHNNLALAYEGSGAFDAATLSWQRVHELASMTGDRVRLERATRHLAALDAVRRLQANPPVESAPATTPSP